MFFGQALVAWVAEACANGEGAAKVLRAIFARCGFFDFFPLFLGGVSLDKLVPLLDRFLHVLVVGVLQRTLPLVYELLCLPSHILQLSICFEDFHLFVVLLLGLFVLGNPYLCDLSLDKEEASENLFLAVSTQISAMNISHSQRCFEISTKGIPRKAYVIYYVS